MRGSTSSCKTKYLPDVLWSDFFRLDGIRLQTLFYEGCTYSIMDNLVVLECPICVDFREG